MVRLLALVLSALLALPAVGQLQTQPTGLKKMDGSDSGGGGGSGDVESVQITASTPLTGSATCTTGACAFTLGLGTVTIAKGGTNITTYTLGDLLYSSATNTLAKLAGNTTTTKMFLMQAGNGSVSAAPAWTATAADFPTLNQSTSGNAATATALAADPADCSAGQYASSINASGTLGCAQVAYSQVSSTPVIGTNTQAWDADLDLLAALSPTTKGDLLVFNGSAWVRLGVGTNTHVLTADSAEASGTKWAAAAGGGLSGLTTGAVQYADSATSIAASPLFRVDANTLAQSNSTTAQTLRVFKSNDGAAGAVGTNYGYGDLTSDANGTVLRSRRAGTVTGNYISIDTPASGFISFQANAVQHSYVASNGRFNIAGLDSSAAVSPGSNDAVDLGSTATLWRLLYLARGTQGSKSKALVDATATNLWQVAVASNSYEGLTLDYTIFATDGSDRQVRAGSVTVAILNNGGTETCVFGTATDAVNTSAGTLTVTWDCTAGTDTVMIRATADTSLASTTTFTMESRYNLTSGTATVTPQ